MKKYLLSLFLLLALYAPALATDVTISSLTVNGFNPANIGVDRSIAVSTAGGSPIVTSSAAFPPTIVGMAGFTVRIDGSNYFVASVESTSSLTLTTNYSGTPGAQVMTLFRYAVMRVYADRAFQPLGSAQVVQPGAVGSGAFFRQVGASVVNNGSINQLIIPEIVLPATTDALITNAAKYTFPFYTPGGAQLTFFLCPSSLSQLRLPPATPTTWTAICSFNSPPAIVPPNREAYTKGEIDFRFPSCGQNNGIFYSVAGNRQNCLTFGNGLTVTGSTLEATAGGSGYNRIQEEGGNLTQRAILNFIGTAFTCVDNAGLTRTDCSIASDLNALAAFGAGTGFAARTAANTWALRTHTGTANEITVTNGNGVSGNPVYSLPAALTFTGKTITGGTYATPTITTPTITGGTHTAITSLGIRSTGSGAFDLTLANTENLTAGRTLTLTLNNAARTLSLNGNLTTGGSFTTTGTFSSGGNFSTGSTFTTIGTFSTGGNFSTASTFSTTGTFSSGGAFSTGAAFTTTPANAVTLTTTGGTNVTLPTTGTLATLAGTETFTNKTLTSPRIGTSILDTNGNELFTLTATGSAVNEIAITNGAAGTGPTIAVSGGDANPNLNINAKGTGRVVIKGYPFNLETNSTAVGNVGAGLDVLHSFSIVAASLAANNDSLRVVYSGTFATNDNDKRIQIEIDSQVIYNSGLFDLDGGEWRIAVDIIRVSATSVRASVGVLEGQVTAVGGATAIAAGNGAILTGRNVTLTVANLTSNAVTLRILGEATSNDDVVCNFSFIDLVQR